MKKRAYAVAAILSVVVLVFALYSRRGMLSEEAMREEFNCNRITADIRETDKYCDDYELYKRDYVLGLIN